MDTYDEMNRFSARRAEGLCELCGTALDALPAPDAREVAAYLCEECRQRTGVAMSDGPAFRDTGQEPWAVRNVRVALAVHRALSGDFSDDDWFAVVDLLTDLADLCEVEGYDIRATFGLAVELWRVGT